VIKLNGMRPSYTPKIISLVVLFIFTVTRGVYFALPPSILSDSPLGALMLFEVPSLIFFIMYTTQLYMWGLVVYQVKKLKITDKQDTLWYLYIATDVAMIVLFIAFVIIFFSVVESALLPCQEGAPPTKIHQTVNLAYLYFLGALSALMAIAVLVIASLLLRILMSDTSKNPAVRELSTMTWLIVLTFPLMFLVRTALLIAASFFVSVPVMVFTLLELFPSAVLLYYIFPWASTSVRNADTTRTTQGRLGKTSSRSTTSSREGVTAPPNEKAGKLRDLIYKKSERPAFAEKTPEPAKELTKAEKVRALYNTKSKRSMAAEDKEPSVVLDDTKQVKADSKTQPLEDTPSASSSASASKSSTTSGTGSSSTSDASGSTS